MVTSYLCYGCVELANNKRTKAYIRDACSRGLFAGDPPPTRWMCECAEDSVGVTFTDPATDSICWYDASIPESADFLGLVIERVGGLRSSSFEREVTDGVTGGSVLSAPAIRGRELVIDAYLVATSCGGMDYGIEWLRRLLEDDGRCPQDGGTCASCQGRMLTVRVHCPEDGHIDRGLHSYPAAGIIDGVDLIEDDYPMGRENCCKIRRVQFTIQTEDAASYSTDPIATDSLLASSANVFQRLGNCPDEPEQFPCCPICESTCDPCSTDPGCDCIPPFVLTPEVVGGVAPCFTDPVCRCIGAINLNAAPLAWEQALRFTIQAGWKPSDEVFSKFGQRNLVLRIYENPDLLATPVDAATYDAFTARYTPCAELGVSWMPAGSQLILDGPTGASWLYCNGSCYDHSARTFGIAGGSLPLIVRCQPLIVMVEWDCLTIQDDATTPNIPSQVTVQTYLRHRL